MLEAPATGRRHAASLAIGLDARRALEPRARALLAGAARTGRTVFIAGVAVVWLTWREVARLAEARVPREALRPASGLLLAGIVVIASLGSGWTVTAPRSDTVRSATPAVAIAESRSASAAQRPVLAAPWEAPALDPLGGPYLADGTMLKPVLVDTAIRGLASPAIAIYAVQRGDTLTGIARRFGVSMMTLWWANDLSSKDVLRVGQRLRVPPITGLLYTVREGDTLASIAAVTRSDADAIREYNRLTWEGLLIGMLLVIPDGVGPPIPTPAPVATTRPAAVATPAPVKPIATMVGVASWMYAAGTAARLPIGTPLRICGDGGCIQRRVTSWGPANLDRIVDLNYLDFPIVCGCGLGVGLTVVRVDILPD